MFQKTNFGIIVLLFPTVFGGNMVEKLELKTSDCNDCGMGTFGDLQMMV